MRPKSARASAKAKPPLPTGDDIDMLGEVTARNHEDELGSFGELHAIATQRGDRQMPEVLREIVRKSVEYIKFLRQRKN